MISSSSDSEVDWNKGNNVNGEAKFNESLVEEFVFSDDNKGNLEDLEKYSAKVEDSSVDTFFKPNISVRKKFGVVNRWPKMKSIYDITGPLSIKRKWGKKRMLQLVELHQTNLEINREEPVAVSSLVCANKTDDHRQVVVQKQHSSNSIGSEDRFSGGVKVNAKNLDSNMGEKLWKVISNLGGDSLKDYKKIIDEMEKSDKAKRVGMTVNLKLLK
ncbi:unnamed protein product [Vicia faba]|uniref:Uncharacterized protein n=1 Tax=Vicia faba TaxID=3906 RepID=A0AAV1AAV9_VICFA|nr:unnamed protein product [Vicia faba]